MIVPNVLLRLHLASRSPRRRELLKLIGVPFDILPFRNSPRTDQALDETPLAGEEPESYVQRVARQKAEFAWQIVESRRLPTHAVLAADTTLEFDGQLIGKPADAQEAEKILARLSGQTHRVLTAVALTTRGKLEMSLSVSEVRFRELEPDEIKRYVATGEPMDKAGAYGIQGKAGIFVDHLAGSYTGVMGLPLCETASLLKRAGFPL
ncbi:MAG TPA: Maf family protein [Accumulibacter sp.]|nr:Maf family protein [Accumulibacter sp.]HMW16210.1 Maf family protein [Accumulibacter sp.]HMX21439.1 Maf family protein [Accumulibacter sp.]HMY06835.1 Maf family protein [Accumulibacter sp.]HNC16721.1 Maf family protein [Accumulibacter sp.]